MKKNIFPASVGVLGVFLAIFGMAAFAAGRKPELTEYTHIHFIS